MPALDVKQAIQRARQFLGELYEDRLFDNVRLEEVAFREADDAWLITLGFDAPEQNPLSTALGQPPREFKVFEIDAATGALRAMKIRRPDYA